MNILKVVVLPVSLIASQAMGCAVAADVDPAGPSSSAEVSEAVLSCPAQTSETERMRGAATLALNLMKHEAEHCVNDTWYWDVPIMSILAPHRYRLRSSGFGIEFDPSDKLYNAVTDAMRADLAFAQEDSGLANFLSDGLKYAWAHTNGKMYPRVKGALALAKFDYPQSLTTKIFDANSANDSHYATVSGSSWCGGKMVTISETVQKSWAYAPLDMDAITINVGAVGGQWYAAPPAAFKGTGTKPWTPFNGTVTTGNPYLIITVQGKKTDWSSYPFTSTNCWELSNFTCTGSIELDPVPYAEPGEYYRTEDMVGTQANPYTLSGTVLFATPDHVGQWATRVVNGRQEWGTFSTPVTMFGYTQYRYTKKY